MFYTDKSPYHTLKNTLESTLRVDDPQPNKSMQNTPVQDTKPYQALLSHTHFWLRFPPAIEAEYQPYLASFFVQANNRFLFLGIFIYLSFFLFDYVVYTDYFFWLFVARLCVILLLAIFLLFLYKNKPLFDNNMIGTTIGVCLCVTQVVIGSFILPLPLNSLYSAGIIPIFIYALVVLRYNFTYTTFFCVFLCIAHGIAMLNVVLNAETNMAYSQVLTVAAISTFIMLVMMACFGMYLVYSIEWLTRKNWLQMQIVQKESEHSKRLSQEMQVLSETDGLTGLKNRRFFDVQLAKQWQLCAEEQAALSLILLDVDWFKSYNDMYGHLAGDVCLQKLAKTIRSHEKLNTQMTCRYGGEEFVILLPHTQSEAALEIAKSIRTRIEAMQIPHEVSPFHVCTASIGVGSIIPKLLKSQHETSLEITALIHKVDKALYQAKALGKNRVHVAQISD